MIDLYTSPTPNGHKISCALEAMGLDYNAIAVNLNYENLNYTIEDGDEIAIIPPVSGG